MLMYGALYGALLFGVATGEGNTVAVSVNGINPTDASFSVDIGGTRWLSSGTMRAFLDDTWHSVKDGGIMPDTNSSQVASRMFKDAIGYGSQQQRKFLIGERKVELITSVYSYDHRADIAIFEQQLPNGASKTAAYRPVLPTGTSTEEGVYPPMLAFPSFGSNNETVFQNLGYVTWNGCMVNEKHKNGYQTPSQAFSDAASGLSGAPIVLFNSTDDASDITAVVIAPLDNFKSSVFTYSDSNLELISLFSEERDEMVLCVKGSKCWFANYGHMYTLVRMEGLVPSPEQIKTAEKVVGRSGITTTLYDYWSPVHGNIVTSEPQPPDSTYCQQSDDCFGMGVVFNVSGVPGTVPLTLYINTTSGHHVTAACEATKAWALEHGYVRVQTVGWVYPPEAIPAQFEAGVTSELEAIPAGFRHRVMIIAGKGITDTINKFGDAIRTLYSTQRIADEDLVTTQLGYFTDNGAYYYGDHYQHDLTCCNESILSATAKDLHQADVPIRYWQMDDWWYPGDPKVWVNCVEEWKLIEQYFPSGLAGLNKELGVPFLLYVPFFCVENAYTDRFKFVTSVNGSKQFSEPHPDNAREFYDMLFTYGQQNGMRSYENDFLNFNFLAIPDFRQKFNYSNGWLAGMNGAALAQEPKVPIQYCMALPSDLMASVQFNAVTNYRASGDYASSGNYNIGGSSLLAFALGLRPSKDNFWSHRPMNSTWGDSNPGRNCELNTMIALLSTGPVSIADKVGDTNKTLLMRTCTPTGALLQPDKPATAIDVYFASTTAPPGHIWNTYASVGGAEYHYSLSIDVSTPYAVQSSDFWPPLPSGIRYVNRMWHKRGSTLAASDACHDGASAVASGCVMTSLPSVHNTRPTVDPEYDTHVFDLLSVYPVDNSSGWVLLGELDKYVGMSSKRFVDVSTSATGLSVEARGSPGEVLTVTALKPVSVEGTEEGIFPRASFAAEWTVQVRTGTVPTEGTVKIVFE
eukprot:m.617139 g.617139  ORF g.617139 m.617139 type:complete len:972 (-) comp22517_c4_seq1:103-3018(-)